MSHRVPLVAVGVLIIAVGIGAADHVDLAELVQIAPWDGLHTITEPAFDDEPYVYPENEVIGVTLGDESHTYPIKLMNYHEVINDVVGGVPIVVAYCPLCGTAIAYERTVEGNVLTFRTSGLLFRNNKVLFDVQTSSLWPMLLGEAINGTHHGTRLRLVTTTRMPFSEWIALHPDAVTVARPWGPVQCPSPCPVPPGFEGYDVNPYATYQSGDSTLAPIRYPDDRLHPKAYVVGVAREGDAWAVAYADLARERVVNVAVGGLPIVVALAADPADSTFLTSAHVYLRGNSTFTVAAATNELVDEEGERYSIRTGFGGSLALTPVDFFYGFWFAWHDFHPDTRLYAESQSVESGISVEHLALAGLVAVVLIALVAGKARQHSSARSPPPARVESEESREKL